MKENQKGVSLYLVVLIMSVMMGIVLGLTSVIIGGAKTAGNLGNSVRAFSAADTGIEMALYQIYKVGSCSAFSAYLPGESSATGYGYAYTVSGTCLSSDMVIDSSGSYLTSSRKIEITFNGNGSSVNGSCGTAAQTYAASASSFGSDTLCVTGNSDPEIVSFPAQGSSVSWVCTNLGGGTDANCTAYHI